MESVKLFDTHTHYDDDAYGACTDFLTDLLSRAENPVAGFLAIGCTLERSGMAVSIAKQFPTAYAAVGIHPGDCEQLPADYLSVIQTLAAEDKVVAIGEIGLDYHYDGYSRDLQLQVFEAQLRLAEELQLPVAIHSRDAAKDTLDMLRRHKGIRGVMHCFSGSAETALALVQSGLYISFTGVLTFNNARRAAEACAAVPLDRLMLETDCPYMAPVPFRGKRCDSSMAWYTARKMAEIKGISADDMVRQSNENAKRLFQIAF